MGRYLFPYCGFLHTQLSVHSCVDGLKKSCQEASFKVKVSTASNELRVCLNTVNGEERQLRVTINKLVVCI